MGAATNNADSTPATAPVERNERRQVALRGHAALADGTTVEITLLDLSYEGCGIEIPLELAPGQHLTLSVLRRGAIEADVIWYADGRAGLVFEPEAEPQPEQQPRAGERHPIAAEVTMRRIGKGHFRVRLFDLSPQGCKTELVERPSAGEQVLVKLDGLEVLEAEVCWVDGFTGGLRFKRPLHPAVFDLLLARLPR